MYYVGQFDWKFLQSINKGNNYRDIYLITVTLFIYRDIHFIHTTNM